MRPVGFFYLGVNTIGGLTTYADNEENLKEIMKIVKYFGGKLAVQKLKGFTHYDCVVSKNKLNINKAKNILIDKYGKDEVDSKSFKIKIK